MLHTAAIEPGLVYVSVPVEHSSPTAEPCSQHSLAAAAAELPVSHKH